MGVCPSRQALRALARNTVAQSLRARANWKLLVRRIGRILRLRVRWAALGLFLQTPRIQDLVVGLERRKGQLRRVRAAPFRR